MSVSLRVSVAIAAIGFGYPAHAAAQTRSPSWEVEVHAGSVSVNSSTAGTPIAQFPTGAPLASPGPAASRAVSSWYFGDGTRLLNDVNAGLLTSARLTPLDGALTKPLARRKEGAAFGFRAARHFTPRFAAEFNLDYGPSRLEITPDATAALDASRASFITAWNALLVTGSTASRTVTSTQTSVDGDGHQITATGAVRIHLGSVGKLRPYATAGGGGVFHRGTLPSATLTGDYGFMFIGFFPVNEHDEVTVSVRARDRSLAGVFGGGVLYDLSPRHGLRADLRFHVGQSQVDTIVSAQPSVRAQSPIFVVTTPFNPNIQFSNNAEVTRFPSSLSGPAVTDLTTFTGRGLETRVQFSVGYVMRF